MWFLILFQLFFYQYIPTILLPYVAIENDEWSENTYWFQVIRVLWGYVIPPPPHTIWTKMGEIGISYGGEYLQEKLCSVLVKIFGEFYIMMVLQRIERLRH